MSPSEGEAVDHTSEGKPSVAAERLVIVAFGASTLAALGLTAVYWTGGQPQLEGVLLAISLAGIGVGLVVWAKRFLPGEEIVEGRPQLQSRPEEVTSFVADFERGRRAILRRGLLLKLLVGSVGALGLALAFPIRSLGPRPGRGLFRTAYRQGIRLVTEKGEPVRPDDLTASAVVTVWPEGFVSAPDSPTLLIKVESPNLLRLPDDRQEWVVEGIVAYSKLCTHTGCPVGLYQAEEHLLLCPCHQSTFDVLRGAKPVFGPATRALPQLPLSIDREGYLIATGDFSGVVGAGFWDRPADETRR